MFRILLTFSALLVVFLSFVSCLSREALTTRKSPTSSNMPFKSKFALVSWVEEGSVGVMPLTAARDRDKLHIGAIVPMKFQGKYYDAELLKISDNKSELNRDCKHLVEFKITREDLLADSETISSTNEEEVTTTMSEPNDVCPHVAELPPAKRSRNKATKAAKPRKSPNLSSNESDKAQAKIAAAKARANRMFRERSSINTTDVSHKNSGLCEETRSESVVQQLNSPSAFSSAELLKMLETQKKEIEEMQDALKKYQSAEASPLPSTPQVRYAKMNGYNVYDENCKKNYTYEEDFHPNDYWSHYNSTWDDTPTTSHSSTWDLTPTANRNPLSKMANKKLEYNSTPKPEKSQNPLQEKVELVEGYNVFISPRQLDEVVASGGGRPTRLIRGLLTAFFDNNTLASSSALGSRIYPAIDPNIRDACIKYVQTQHKEVARTAMIDAINDKCAQCRRKNSKPAELFVN